MDYKKRLGDLSCSVELGAEKLLLLNNVLNEVPLKLCMKELILDVIDIYQERLKIVMDDFVDTYEALINSKGEQKNG